MNDKKYQYTLYLIIAVIIATIGLQGYWNYKNYQLNKQQLITDVQTSLDKAVDNYYSNLAQETTMGLRLSSHKNRSKKSTVHDRLRVLKNNDSSYTTIDSINANEIQSITVIQEVDHDQLKKNRFTSIWMTDSINPRHKRFKEYDSIFRKAKGDSVLIKSTKNSFPNLSSDTTRTFRFSSLNLDSTKSNNPFEILTSKIILSLNKDSLDVKKVDSLFQSDLKTKKINLTYHINYNKPKEIFPSFFLKQENKKATIADSIKTEKKLSVISKSTFLPKGSELKVNFSNANWVALKRGISAILISLLLILAVISCLFFLLKIIKNQKQLAEVKNDLISNITHEFKTPIATIGVALESINNFNVIEDKAKTKRYVDMSSNQLSKLNLMVEKLLETATLDSESLKFNKEKVDISNLLYTLNNRYKAQYPEKTFINEIEKDSLIINADPFHFENALNNILDNAVKYGGSTIFISLKKQKSSIEIKISDTGNTLKNEIKHRIFEKFYRVPKGNTHDIKGYGIGLYYTKTIINKHAGSIALDLRDKLTTFQINIPDGQ